MFSSIFYYCIQLGKTIRNFSVELWRSFKRCEFKFKGRPIQPKNLGRNPQMWGGLINWLFSWATSSGESLLAHECLIFGETVCPTISHLQITALEIFYVLCSLTLFVMNDGFSLYSITKLLKQLCNGKWYKW